MNHTHTTSLAIKIILIIFIFITGIYCYKANKTIKNNNATISRNEIATREINNSNKHLTKPKAYTHFASDKPNLFIVEKNSRNRMNKAIDLACHRLRNHKEIQENQGKIKAFIGDDAGSTLINDTRFVPSKETANNQAIEQANRFIGSQIGFGKYDSIHNTIPMNVIIKYQTSPYVNDSGNIQGIKPEPRVFYNAFQFNIHIINAYNLQFNVSQQYHSENNEY